MNELTEKTQTVSTIKTAHTLQLERRKKAIVTGVTDVCSFHENEIIMKLEGQTLFITGQNLHIGKLLPDEGRLDIDGQVDSIVYEIPRKLSAGWLLWRKKRT